MPLVSRNMLIPVALLAAILVGSLIPVKNFLPPHLVGDITDACHYPSGIVLGVLLGPFLRRSPRKSLIAWALGVSFFGIIELVQPSFGRYGTLDDWIKSSAGLTLGLIANFLDAKTPAPLRRLFMMVGLAMMVAFSKPLIDKFRQLDAYEKRFPVVADFEHWDELLLWRPFRGVRMTLENKGSRFADIAEQFPEIAMQNSRYARVAYPANRYPETLLYNVVKDWHSYRKLCLDSRADRDGQSLEIRLADSSAKGLQASWSQVYPNPAQWHTLCIDLTDLKTTDGKPLNLSQVNTLALVGPEKSGAGWFDVDSIRLVP